MNEDTRSHILKLADDIEAQRTFDPTLHDVFGPATTDVGAALRELAEEPRRTLLELAEEFEAVAAGMLRRAENILADKALGSVSSLGSESYAFRRAAARLRERAEEAK